MYRHVTSDPLLNLDLMKLESEMSSEQTQKASSLDSSPLKRSVSESAALSKHRVRKVSDSVDGVIPEIIEDNVFPKTDSQEALNKKVLKSKARDSSSRDIFSDSETVEPSSTTRSSKVKSGGSVKSHKRSRSDVIGMKSAVVLKELQEEEERTRENSNSNGNTGRGRKQQQQWQYR